MMLKKAIIILAIILLKMIKTRVMNLITKTIKKTIIETSNWHRKNNDSERPLRKPARFADTEKVKEIVYLGTMEELKKKRLNYL